MLLEKLVLDSEKCKVDYSIGDIYARANSNISCFDANLEICEVTHVLEIQFNKFRLE